MYDKVEKKIGGESPRHSRPLADTVIRRGISKEIEARTHSIVNRRVGGQRRGLSNCESLKGHHRWKCRGR